MNERKGLERVTARLRLLHNGRWELRGREGKKEKRRGWKSLSTSLVTTTPTAPQQPSMSHGSGTLHAGQGVQDIKFDMGNHLSSRPGNGT